MPIRSSQKKCSSISYNCGAICLSLQKNCRIGADKIGKDRLSKVIALAEMLASGGIDTRRGLGRLQPEQLEGLAASIQKSRDEQAQQVRKERNAARSAEIEGFDNGRPDGSRSGQPVEGAVKIKVARADITPTPNTEVVPEGLRQHLSEDQLIGAAAAISSMDKHGGFLLADGTGVGKTRQILTVAGNYAAQGKKVLIVTKSEVIKPDWKKGTLTGSFQNDGDAMGVNPRLLKDDSLAPGEVGITTYDNLSKVKGSIGKDTVLIYDEAHAMKNSDSQRTKHGMDMSSAADKVLFATATPADKPTHIDYLMRAGVFGGNTKKEVYEWMGMRQREINVGGGKTVKTWEVDPKVGVEKVYHRLAGIFDGMTEKGQMIKREISMEGVGFGFQTITLPKEAYDMLEKIDKNYDHGNGLEAAQALMQQRRQLEPYKIPATVDLAKKAMGEGKQAVIFVSRVSESSVGSNSKEGETIASSEGTAGSLKKALLDAGIHDDEITELHGGSKNSGADAMKAFQSGKAKVIIATVESGGTGVNLDDTVGNAPRSLIMMTPPFSAVENVQAIGRVWRMKSKSYPEVNYVFTDTAVDTWNREIIAGKVKALGAAVQGETGQMGLPVDISEDGIAAFNKGKGNSSQQGEDLGPTPRLPAPKKKLPAGTMVNKYGGYYQGKWIAPGEGYVRNEGGRWIIYPKGHFDHSDDWLAGYYRGRG